MTAPLPAQPLTPDDHVRGIPGGSSIVEYGDYQCPYSRAAYRHVQRVERRLAGRLCFCFRNFPREDIHPLAWGAALAAEAAAEQGLFWEMHDLLFHRQEALAPEDLRRHAADAGLDLARFDADTAARVGEGRIRGHLRGGRAAGVQRIPVLFLDGRRHEGRYRASDLLRALGEPAQRPVGTSPSSE
jgi:protein-disulfide isomerase